MIPPFEPDSGNLPPGVHEATWDEFVDRYGYNQRRSRLLQGLYMALNKLREAGCRTVYIDGSFVTSKDEPGDFDACWDIQGVDLSCLDPVLKTFDNLRAAQKDQFGGELFPATWPADASGATFLRFFQRDRETGRSKGIVEINLGGLP